MKNILIYIFVLSSFIFIGCDNEDSDEVSRVTNYATVEILGNSLIVLTQGDTYTEPGAKSTINGASVDYSIKGTVNTSVPDVYKLSYETINSDGFPASASRTVVVLSSAPSIYNLAGDWARSNGSPAVVVQLSDRVYTHNNAGGVEGDDQLMVTFYNIDDDELYIPLTADASESGLTVESIDGYVEDNDHFTWVLNASGYYGTADRIFTRQ